MSNLWWHSRLYFGATPYAAGSPKQFRELLSDTAMAQSQAEVTKEAQKAGIAHAQANDDGAKYRGRKPTFNLEQFRMVQDLLRQGIPIFAIAKTT